MRKLHAFTAALALLWMGCGTGTDVASEMEALSCGNNPSIHACGDACVNILSDTSNCGACGNVCAANQVCTAAVCLVPCGTPGYSNCNGFIIDGCEVNTESDHANCGACGHACGPAQTCSSGSCTCPGGETICGSNCANLSADTGNCGSCGRACGPAQSCSAGVCLCPGGTTLCGDNSCHVLSSDVNNCGACGNVCGSGKSCINGSCTVTACSSGQEICSGGCVSELTDNNNCGSCGNRCASGTLCENGACMTNSCPNAFYGQETVCNGTCTDTFSDSNNCGSCGRVCPASSECYTPGTGSPTPLCFALNAAANNFFFISPNCPAGFVAINGDGSPCVRNPAACGSSGAVCGSGLACSNDTCCAPGQIGCGGSCVANDRNNCGACGNVCSAAQSCTAGACVCPSGQSACGSSCVNLTSDLKNCGACENVCQTGLSCAAGVCAGPAVETKFERLSVAGGATRITFKGTPNATYEVEVSHDLVNWSVLANVTANATDGTFLAVDINAGKYSEGFYRAVLKVN